jgi:capsular polysaccharide transport system ATP-binding protein
MIVLRNIVDRPRVQGRRADLAKGVNLVIPNGRYALLAKDPRLRRPAIDLLAGSRLPAQGNVYRHGLVSWLIGRAGFARGKVKGFHLIALIARLYSLDLPFCEAIIAELMTNPRFLGEPLDRWDAPTRFEVMHAIGLLPRFDIYLIHGSLPALQDRFHRLWRPLFEERIEGRTLILLTTRAAEAEEYCDKAIVLRDGQIFVDEEIDQAVRRYPPRPIPGVQQGAEQDFLEVDQLL